MKRAVITNDDHWVVIDGIRYLRGDISPIEPVLTTGVKIRGDNVNPMVIAVDGTTVNGVAVASQADLIEWFEQNSFKTGGGTGEGVQSVSGDLVDNTDPNNPKVNFNTNTVSTDDDPYQMSGRGTYTFTGDSATWSLPSISSTFGQVIRVISWGDGILTITGEINESGSDLEQREMTKGETATFTNNGFKWVIT